MADQKFRKVWTLMQPLKLKLTAQMQSASNDSHRNNGRLDCIALRTMKLSVRNKIISSVIEVVVGIANTTNADDDCPSSLTLSNLMTQSEKFVIMTIFS